jgi:adenine deaminase
MDRVLRHAVSHGLPPVTAIQMMTINVAEHFGLARELGMIAPGRWADVVLARNLRDFRAELVIAKGQVVARAGRLKLKQPESHFPRWARNSVHLKHALRAEDFALRAGVRASHLRANVIGVIENQAPTRHLVMEIRTQDGTVRPEPARDIAKLALIQRHDGMGGIRVALVKGFGFTERCAVGSTVAHDCHHMLIVGTDEAQMAIAANELARIGGGQIVVKDGRIIGAVDLPIAGLMSSDPVTVVARKAESVLAGFRACGCHINNPNMQLSLLALAVIPELRISDKGLVDVTRFGFIPVLERI